MLWLYLSWLILLLGAQLAFYVQNPGLPAPRPTHREPCRTRCASDWRLSAMLLVGARFRAAGARLAIEEPRGAHPRAAPLARAGDGSLTNAGLLTQTERQRLDAGEGPAADRRARRSSTPCASRETRPPRRERDWNQPSAHSPTRSTASIATSSRRTWRIIVARRRRASDSQSEQRCRRHGSRRTRGSCRAAARRCLLTGEREPVDAAPRRNAPCRACRCRSPRP